MSPRAVLMILVASLVCSLPAAADPVRAVSSLEARGGAALDDRLGVAFGGRVGAEWRLGERVALGVGGDVGIAKWWSVGDDTPEDLVETQVFGQIHVGVQLTPTLRLEPAVGGGALHLSGALINGWLPSYHSSVAIVRGSLRAGLRSVVAIGDLEVANGGTFDPATELHVFVGWQR